MEPEKVTVDPYGIMPVSPLLRTNSHRDSSGCIGIGRVCLITCIRRETLITILEKPT